MLRPFSTVPARSAAQRLAARLPQKWQRLSTLSEPVCEALLTLVVAYQGSGCNAIQASLKLEKLATMPASDIEAAYAQRAGA